MSRVRQCCLALCLLHAVAAQAQLYKWVGPDGKVSYSDTPPPTATTRVETKSLTAGGASATDFPYELAETIKSHPVMLYTTKNCVPCDDGRRLLSERGIPFNEKTVNSNEDAAQFRKVGGEGQLPLLVVGRIKERGFEAGAWNSALSTAGYPESSKLPKTYRNPQPEAAAPTSKSANAKDSAENDRTAAKPSVTELPPAIGNAPPGFRF